MTKREYSTIALGVTCFVLLSALFVSLKVSLMVAIIVALLVALEASWLYHSPQLWVQAHTVTLPKFRFSFMAGIRNIVGFILLAASLCLSVFIIYTGMIIWYGNIFHMQNWGDHTLFAGTSITLVLLCASVICAMVLTGGNERLSPKSWKHFGLSLLVSLGVAMAWPLVPLGLALIVGFLLLWVCVAILVGIALLATEVHMLVVTGSIIIGSLASLIPGVAEVTPLHLILRITLGAIAGFATGEALHRLGQFLALTKRGRCVTDMVLIRR